MKTQTGTYHIPWQLHHKAFFQINLKEVQSVQKYTYNFTSLFIHSSPDISKCSIANFINYIVPVSFKVGTSILEQKVEVAK